MEKRQKVGWLKTAVQKLREFAYRPRRVRRAPAAAVRPKVGLALGGGFARGIAHVGILGALEKHDIPVDCIAGTSVGALIGAMYAAGTPLGAMERQAAETHFTDFGKWTISWLGFASNARIGDYLHRASPVQQFAEMRIPLAIVATDLGTGEPVHFTQGDVVPPLRASCAYPGLFLPVEHQGRVLVDGFLAAPVPVEAAKQMGADIVLAVYLDSAANNDKPDNLIEIIGRSFAIMQRHANRNWRAKADVVLEPVVSQFAWDDFGRTAELLAAGEAAVTEALPAIRALLARPPAAAAADRASAAD
jgi:NTE family protein